MMYWIAINNGNNSKWIENPTDEIKKEMATRGDIHIQNVYRFFGKWVEKKNPLRQAVKQ